MPVFQCNCGTQFALSAPPVGAAVTCPGCGRRQRLPAPPLNEVPRQAAPTFAPPKQHQPVRTVTVVRQRAENQNSVLGFILAILSFFTCLLLAPFAVIFSARGLRERDGQGYAIAGLLIGIFQSFSLLVLVIYFVVVAVAVGSAGAAIVAILAKLGIAAAEEAERQVATATAIQQARVSIQRHFEEQGAWPSAPVGTELIEQHKDAWRRALRYEHQGGRQQAVVSAGADGRFGTSDDIAERWHLESTDEEDEAFPFDFPPSSSLAIDEIGSTDDAIAMVEARDYRARLAGLEWLATAEVEEEQRSQVLKAVLPLLTDSVSGDSAAAVSKQWSSAESASLIVAHFEEPGRRTGPVEARRLVQLLVGLESQSQLLALINHSEDWIQREAWKWAQRERIKPQTLLKQHAKDVLDESRQMVALSHLDEMKVDVALRDPVCKMLDPLLTSRDPRVSHEALQVISKWGPTRDNLESLIAIEATEQIARVPDPRAIAYLGQMLKEWPVKFNKAARELRKIGPAGESCVWPLLSDDKHVVQIQALQLLSQIGTRKSLPHLQRLRDGRLVGNQANATIRAIEAANREPVDWSKGE